MNRRQYEQQRGRLDTINAADDLTNATVECTKLIADLIFDLIEEIQRIRILVEKPRVEFHPEKD